MKIGVQFRDLACYTKIPLDQADFDHLRREFICKSWLQKNAILIVEFAKLGVDKGRPIVDAALEGAKLRLRPILMTSFAFILGCVPLWRASGSGAVSRQVMGTAVIGGMTAASAIAIFIIPALFYIVEKLGGAKRQPAKIPLTPPAQAGSPAAGDD